MVDLFDELHKKVYLFLCKKKKKIKCVRRFGVKFEYIKNNYLLILVILIEIYGGTFKDYRDIVCAKNAMKDE